MSTRLGYEVPRHVLKHYSRGSVGVILDAISILISRLKKQIALQVNGGGLIHQLKTLRTK